MELKLPEGVVEEVGEKELKLYLAMMLYKERKLSIGQAAQLAGLAVSDFLYELGKRDLLPRLKFVGFPVSFAVARLSRERCFREACELPPSLA